MVRTYYQCGHRLIRRSEHGLEVFNAKTLDWTPRPPRHAGERHYLMPIPFEEATKMARNLVLKEGRPDDAEVIELPAPWPSL